ncbi:hypothetical protein [Photobacterium damselae]|uniref:hypothetical protein n=1 Tax=Photobacterium damselae TaxID=38293 RepID=UPI001EFD23DD|nr:hypothetical protein [Photobacterium damselae]MCG9707126.1 hypothetical protein [Photobacterium damselae]
MSSDDKSASKLDNLADQWKAENTPSSLRTSAGKYDVGLYYEIKGTVPGLDAHHAGQKAAMRKLVDGYDPKTGPSILVPKVGHTIKGPNGIVSRSTKGIDSARDLLARDVKELRRVYPDLPNIQRQNLINLNKEMYLY